MTFCCCVGPAIASVSDLVAAVTRYCFEHQNTLPSTMGPNIDAIIQSLTLEEKVCVEHGNNQRLANCADITPSWKGFLGDGSNS